MTGPQLILVGPPGAGKTTVGRLVAAAKNLAFRDTDDDVADMFGAEVAAVFIDHGEAAFRAAEERVVLAALDEHDGVLALGGGAVLSAQTRAALAGRPVVLLSVGLADAAKRVGLARDRPVLTLNPRAHLHALLAARAPLYAEVASRTVSTDGCSPDQVAAEILAAWPV